MLKDIDKKFYIFIILYMDKIIAINPSYDSRLVSEIFKFEKMRYTRLSGTTPPWLFFDLKEIMHILESVASARIEGNHTTLMQATMDSLSGDQPPEREELRELRNIRKAIEFIEQEIGDNRAFISPTFIRELHKILVDGLIKDGSKSPGKWRSEPVKISKSKVQTAQPVEIDGLMQELCEYISRDDGNKMDVIKIAIAHHRFTVIHPFDNGNGRTARLLTYAMLVKMNLINETMRTILNPSSIFCIDRQKYYDMLALADTGTQEGVEEWCLYVVEGVTNEMERVSRLLNRDYAVCNIIEPALKNALNSNFISKDEYNVLKIAMEKDLIQAQDVKHLFGTSASASVQTSRVLANMREKRLLMVHPKYQKKYVMRFANNYLSLDVLKAMDKNGLLKISGEVNNEWL